MADRTFQLNSGAIIPALGLGTWQSEPGAVRKAVTYAIQSGYRHIDCAYCYGNEAEVGQGIRDALQATGIQRSELFITTKLWCTYHTRTEIALGQSLQLLGLEYVDLYLMHWPIAMNPRGNHELFPRLANGSRDILTTREHIDTYKDMEMLQASGKTKAIGVCNYSKAYLERLLPRVNTIPAVNQIGNQPLLPQQEIVDLCKDHGIHVTVYSPLGSTGSPLVTNDVVGRLARLKDTTPASILLSYHSESCLRHCRQCTNPLSRARQLRTRQIGNTCAH